ncbi:type II toxin-antitoxin system RelE family toxin [Scytonema sp. NUACC26]|uniref:type II toxin-antitoxin system RelE family toxin n=1 Tax=Scytonema sp. NUACC26 TaxID=3140176 RepID=UPI0034DC448D
MNYQVIFSKGALKQFKKLPLDLQERIQTDIDELAIEPRPNGVKKLENDLYRIRVGDYRVIYQIQDNICLVNIVKVSHRSKAYRDES